MPTQIIYYDEVRRIKSKSCKKLKIEDLGYSCEILSAQKIKKIDRKTTIINTLKKRITNAIVDVIGDGKKTEIEQWVNAQLLSMDWDSNIEKIKDRRITTKELTNNGIKKFNK